MVKIGFCLGGGYPERARQLDPKVRAAIKERDLGLCGVCGQPASEIDHIAGSSSELSNLQLLCHASHQRKTELAFRPIEPGSPADLLRRELMSRIEAPLPLRECDDEVAWPTRWRHFAGLRDPQVKVLTDANDSDDDDLEYADDTDLPGFRGWTDQGTPIQEF